MFCFPLQALEGQLRARDDQEHALRLTLEDARKRVRLTEDTCLGLQAKAGGWLERPLTEQLDVHPFVLLGFVAIEAAGIAVASLDVDKFGLVLVLLAGMFCLDMSLLTLLVFQRWGNVETRATRFLARGAFGVYLLHPLVVTAATRVYLQLAGDGVNYPVGFGVVAVVSLLVVWPLAYSLAQLPGLRAVL